MREITTPDGYRIGRTKKDDGWDHLIFNDERIAEAIEKAIRLGHQILLTPVYDDDSNRVEGVIRVGISYGDAKPDHSVSDAFEWAEQGQDKSLLKALRYALGYHYASWDDFQEADEVEKLKNEFLSLMGPKGDKGDG